MEAYTITIDTERPPRSVMIKDASYSYPGLEGEQTLDNVDDKGLDVQRSLNIDKNGVEMSEIISRYFDATGKSSGTVQRIVDFRHVLSESVINHKTLTKFVIKGLCLTGVCVYLFFVIKHHGYSFESEDSKLILAVCFCVILCILFSFVPNSFLNKSSRWTTAKVQVSCYTSRKAQILHWMFLSLVTLSIVAYIVIGISLKNPKNLWSLLGVFVIVTIMFLASRHPGKVQWRIVVWGLFLQMTFALLVLRTSWGYDSCNWMAKKLTDYLSHTNEGARFVFGESFREHYFAFVLLPTIVMFSTTISVLYYLGVMKVFINAISFVIRKTLGTGPMETLHATFNIFVGWAETIAVVRPLLDEMTLSELHAIMTNGFATVSGGTMAAYIIFGAPANHLIAASFMSAPAALALSKLFYPEVDLTHQELISPKIVQTERGVIEAASRGAINAIPLVAYILVHVIAFVSILDFINGFIAWIGEQVGIKPPDYPDLSFQFVCSYVMSPVAFLLGVEFEDLRVSGRMLGLKIFVNEFVAFQDLGQVVKNNVVFRNYTSVFPNDTWRWTNTDDVFLNATGQTLIGGIMSDRSSTVTTYALCGFSDFIALGMMIGALTAAAPKRAQDILKVAFRALFCGIMATFLTAALAGLLSD